MYKSLDDLRAEIRGSIEHRDFEQYEAYKRQVVASALGERFEGKIADEVYENARDNLMRNIRIGLQQQGMSWEDYVNQNGGEQQINMMLMLPDARDGRPGLRARRGLPSCQARDFRR